MGGKPPRRHAVRRRVTPQGSSVPVYRARTAAAACALLALMCGAHGAHAALFDDDEARKRIALTNQRLEQFQRDVDARISGLEQQLKNQGLVELLNSLEALKTDMARLRGQLEVVSYEISEAQRRQRDLYVDIDSRLRRLETVPVAASSGADAAIPPGPGPAAVLPPPPSVAPPVSVPVPGPAVPVPGPAAPATGAAANAAAEQRAYDAALDQFKRGDFPSAIASFTAFVKAWPRSPLSPSAQHWIGNAQFARRDYRASISAQRQLILNYPESQKIPDALLNIASAQSELADNAIARRTLEELIVKYPQSEAAAKARQRLGMR